jgi:hypothetical protein
LVVFSPIGSERGFFGLQPVMVMPALPIIRTRRDGRQILFPANYVAKPGRHKFFALPLPIGAGLGVRNVAHTAALISHTNFGGGHDGY